MSTVIGLGTGRSGTTSLAALLNAQRGAHVGHESYPWTLPWSPDPADIKKAGKWLGEQDGYLVGDVSHAWLPMVQYLDGVRCIALRRRVEDTVDSFVRAIPAAYIQEDGTHGRAEFPTYDLPERGAWRRYVQVYHFWADAEPSVRVFPMNALNSRAGQRHILRAAGVPADRHRYLLDCHKNAYA